MRFWNDGKDEANMVQNRFTKYLVVSVHRKKSAVLQGRKKIRDMENSTDDWETLPGIAVDEDYTQQVSVPLDFENAALSRALAQLKERERYIFYAHILEERGFSEAPSIISRTTRTWPSNWSAVSLAALTAPGASGNSAYLSSSAGTPDMRIMPPSPP